MTPLDAANLLKLLSATDGRASSKETATAWAFALDDISYADALQALRAHQRGEHRHEFFSHNHIRDFIEGRDRSDRRARRLDPDQVEADVRSAKLRGLLPADWPRGQALTPEVTERLAAARTAEVARIEAFNAAAYGVQGELPTGGQPFGEVGRSMP